jgi:thiosulfate dehydrogenase (quinone) large subunit
MMRQIALFTPGSLRYASVKIQFTGKANFPGRKETYIGVEKMAQLVTRRGEPVREPQIVKKLLSDPRAGWLWLVLRIWLGWQWLTSGWGKVSNPAWVQSGEALKGFWERAVVIPDGGRPVVAFDWYRAFLQSMLDAQAYTWFAKLVTYGEVLIGIALIIGAFTGIAAFFGAFMNWNFMMAGTASTNPMLLVVAIGLILAWKVAGYLGADYFLLRWIGTPWLWFENREAAVRQLQPQQTGV